MEGASKVEITSLVCSTYGFGTIASVAISSSLDSLAWQLMTIQLFIRRSTLATSTVPNHCSFAWQVSNYFGIAPYSGYPRLRSTTAAATTANEEGGKLLKASMGEMGGPSLSKASLSISSSFKESDVGFL